MEVGVADDDGGTDLEGLGPGGLDAHADREGRREMWLL